MKKVFYPADILLPKKGTDMYRWSVVACDQFTSEPEYWEKTEGIVGEAPSALRMILPEVYLDGPKEEEKLENIRRFMTKYLSEDIFSEYKDALIYVERTDSGGKMRAGIVGCVDLEQYDYHKGSGALVRATEATVEERIPARIRVRKNAELELPHIMLLIDDKKHLVIESCEKYKKQENLLYDFDLMQGGGRLKGYLLEKDAQNKIMEALDALAKDGSYREQRENGKRKQAEKIKTPMIFAVGDGNHSLASAKEYYEQLKASNPERDYSGHPARYALAEIVNLHSPALEFEAIHRIVQGVDVEELLREITEKLGLIFEEKEKTGSAAPLEKQARQRTKEAQSFYVVRRGNAQRAVITKPCAKLTAGSLQNVLDDYQKKNSIKIDYIHGEDVLRALTMEENSVGFLLPVMKKEELFPTVMEDGALPRKTFSMGSAQDKRYYTECRKIR